MAVLDMTYVGESVLRQKAKPVPSKDPSLAKLVQDMIETMHHQQGIGLAAPQVGISKRVFVVDIGDGPLAFINPKFVAGEGEHFGIEGCLSIPGIFGEVPRYEKVVFESQMDPLSPKQEKFEAEGLMAVVLQHEFDHLEGRLFTDIAEQVYDQRWIDLQNSEEDSREEHA